MKLTLAKCPSCGANIEVDKNEEYTTCSYCKNNILIEDAVLKYKLEITGKIKISGIKDNEDRLSDAKKYLKLKEFKNAITILNSIINNEPFNIEAYILYIKSYINQFNILYTNEEYKTDYDNNNTFWNDVNHILSIYDRLQAIDDKNTYKQKLKTELSILKKMQNEKEKLEQDIKICLQISSMIEEITTYKFTPKISKKVKRNYKKINKIVIKYFLDTLGYDVLKTPDKIRCINRNLEIKYYNSASKFKSNKITKYNSLKEVKDVLQETKEKIITKIEKSAAMSTPIGIIKNVIKKRHVCK